jgi:VanZ family protein
MIERFPLFTVLATALILVAVTIPGNALPDMPATWFGIDKIAHLLMFLVWAAAVHADFDLATFRQILPAFIGCAVFSVLTEILQLFAEGRSFDLFDSAFDMLGFIIGVFARNFLLRPLWR